MSVSSAATRLRSRVRRRSAQIEPVGPEEFMDNIAVRKPIRPMTVTASAEAIGTSREPVIGCSHAPSKAGKAARPKVRRRRQHRQLMELVIAVAFGRCENEEQHSGQPDHHDPRGRARPANDEPEKSEREPGGRQVHVIRPLQNRRVERRISELSERAPVRHAHHRSHRDRDVGGVAARRMENRLPESGPVEAAGLRPVPQRRADKRNTYGGDPERVEQGANVRAEPAAPGGGRWCFRALFHASHAIGAKIRTAGT